MTETILRAQDGNGHTPDERPARTEHTPIEVDGTNNFTVICSCGQPVAEEELAKALVYENMRRLRARMDRVTRLVAEIQESVDCTADYLIDRLVCGSKGIPASDSHAMAEYAGEDADDLLYHPSGAGPLAGAVRDVRDFRLRRRQELRQSALRLLAEATYNDDVEVS